MLAIVGATGTGKSELSLDLAEQLDGEIVNADSMQVYRGMDIGTAKLPARLRRGIDHHLLDIWDVRAAANVAEYQRRARAAIGEVHGRGRLPILVGGSGLYVWAALRDLRFPATTPRCGRSSRRCWPRPARRRCTGSWRPSIPLRLRPSCRATAVDRARARGHRHHRPALRGRPRHPEPVFRTLTIGLTMERTARPAAGRQGGSHVGRRRWTRPATCPACRTALRRGSRWAIGRCSTTSQVVAATPRPGGDRPGNE